MVLDHIVAKVPQIIVSADMKTHKCNSETLGPGYQLVLFKGRYDYECKRWDIQSLTMIKLYLIELYIKIC